MVTAPVPVPVILPLNRTVPPAGELRVTVLLPFRLSVLLKVAVPLPLAVPKVVGPEAGADVDRNADRARSVGDQAGGIAGRAHTHRNGAQGVVAPITSVPALIVVPPV